MKENVGGRRQEQQVKVGAVHEGVPFPGLIESYRNHPACPETNQRTAPTERSFCQQIALCGLNSPSPLRPGQRRTFGNFADPCSQVSTCRRSPYRGNISGTTCRSSPATRTRIRLQALDHPSSTVQILHHHPGGKFTTSIVKFLVLSDGDKECRLQELCKFPESANMLSSTSVYINEEFSKPTTSICNQEDKENPGGKEGRLQELCEFPENANMLPSASAYINEEFSKPTTSMCNQEDKENSGHENFHNANVVASLLLLFHCNGKKGRRQEPCKFPESANILSSTSVYINEEFSKLTTSMCNQEDKENAGYENFDNANAAASLLMLFHCSGKESRLQGFMSFQKVSPQLVFNFYLHKNYYNN
ncbi:hypothetical protein GEV33_000074 [Tenebrio molitor]|uniref:Uncharacterized protein n=1 Tax=Tenebrio molitor TaxID=7067 RepID=A0A8J6HYT7_TENMO|nr:hypothetical protein GEV33_000074 [Tenebrio molitor]